MFNKANLSGANLTKADVGRGSSRAPISDRGRRSRQRLPHQFRGRQPERRRFPQRLHLQHEFQDADLSGVKNLVQDQLDIACGNDATVLPPGLKKPSRWNCEE